MDRQAALFSVAPSHVYVTAHWERHGWIMTIHSTSGIPGCGQSTREAYGPLSGEELVDVCGAALAAILT